MKLMKLKRKKKQSIHDCSINNLFEFIYRWLVLSKMNITLTSLEALILKATYEALPCPDAAALEAFYVVMRDATEGPQLAAQALAARIHSLNPREALLALTMLDRCMRRCDASFHAEVGKFRFLNEMIKLVSPKYFADRTSPEVRTRVLQLLHAWSIEYPNETKFKVAYDMLKNQGVVKETPPPLPPEDGAPPRSRYRKASFEDEEKSKLLQKLLQSKKPEDLQHANRLIKSMVKEEERRTEQNSRRAQEVNSALDSAELLKDLIANAENASVEEDQLITDLYSSCTSLRIALQRLAVGETLAESLNEILHASTELDDAIDLYNIYTRYRQDKVEKLKHLHVDKDKDVARTSESLLDFAGASGDANTAAAPTNTMDELGDIFATGTQPITEPLKPVTLMPNDDVDLLGDKPTPKPEGWNELDSLGEQLIKDSLPDNAKRLESFNSKPSKKIPMNALTSPKREAPQSNGALLDLDFFTKKPDEPKTTDTAQSNAAADDLIVDISTEPTPSTSSPKEAQSLLNNILDLSVPLEETKREASSPETEDDEKKDKKSEVKPLTDINVSLSSVQPSTVPPMTVFEEGSGLHVVLHFCKDKPRPDVNVIVISTTNKSKAAVEDYRFQGMVPKGCKIRLLPASGTSLPEANPFLPPPAITQVMLIGRPSSRPQVDLRFILTYNCDDDNCSEIGEVKDLPLDLE